MFEEQDITLTSPEDNEKDTDNVASLYGNTYYDLLDATESIVIQMLEQAGISRDKYTPTPNTRMRTCRRWAM